MTPRGRNAIIKIKLGWTLAILKLFKYRDVVVKSDMDARKVHVVLFDIQDRKKGRQHRVIIVYNDKRREQGHHELWMVMLAWFTKG